MRAVLTLIGSRPKFLHALQPLNDAGWLQAFFLEHLSNVLPIVSYFTFPTTYYSTFWDVYTPPGSRAEVMPL